MGEKILQHHPKLEVANWIHVHKNIYLTMHQLRKLIKGFRGINSGVPTTRAHYLEIIHINCQGNSTPTEHVTFVNSFYSARKISLFPQLQNNKPLCLVISNINEGSDEKISPQIASNMVIILKVQHQALIKFDPQHGLTSLPLHQSS